MFTLPDDLHDYKQTSQVFYYVHVNHEDTNNSRIQFSKPCISIGINGIKKLHTPDGLQVFHPEDLIFYTPGNYLSYQNIDNDEPYKSLMIFFDAQQFSNLSRQFEDSPVTNNFPDDRHYLSLRRDPHVAIFLNAVMNLHAHEGAFTTAMQKIKLVELIVYLKRIFGNFLMRAIQLPRQLSELQLREVVENETNSNLTLEEFAFMCNMSLATFKRSFTKIYGTSPGKWLRERKLVWAEEQISKYYRLPKEVYHEAGYHDYSSFSYAFKQKFGVSPRRTSKLNLMPCT